MPFSAYFYDVTDGASGDSSIPLVTPSTLLLSSRGRVKLCQNNGFGCGPPAHLAGYLAPEYRTHRRFTDTDVEKVKIALYNTLYMHESDPSVDKNRSKRLIACPITLDPAGAATVRLGNLISIENCIPKLHVKLA